ncbi:hypothetical protein NW752_003358 [Fusarium irregulare]|uniref:Apple domain-containing protein n=1 Tax=Fusarium irregulare TaxID=2494466 RepID=A0A9W8PSE9_9HYPO|nr:hypothetical protein NW766_004426 [Fusarium irregulare]KAJ4022903.1 hypothetical protein NW752_003358 [Fusarium irregulare]
MSRFALLAGSVALLAISGVNAGPCRPSSSVVPSGLQISTTSTEVGESSATLAWTSTTETEVSGTLSVTVSTIETPTTSEDTATESTTTTEIITAGVSTAAEAETTTTGTTVVLATTSAAPVLQPGRDCGSVSTPYTAPNGVAYNILCNTDFEPAFFDLGGLFEDATSFEECLLKCATSSGCNGVQWDNLNSYCVSMRSYRGTMQTPGNDIAIKVGG